MRLIETPFFKMVVLRPQRTVTSQLISYYLGAALPHWCPEVVISLGQTSGPERFEGGCSTPLFAPLIMRICCVNRGLKHDTLDGWT